MKITLTGAAGNLGSVVCRHLSEKGYDITATDISYRSDLPVPIDVADLLDRASCYRVLKGAEALVHLANHPSFQGRDGQRIHNENVSMDFNVFEAARQMGVKTIVFSSSIQAMAGDRHHKDDIPSGQPYLPLNGDIPARPGNPYGLSKQAGENMLQYMVRQWGMNAVALRFPWLIRPEWEHHMRDEKRTEPWPRENTDEAFTFLRMADAASLIEAILRAKLTGYRCYFPVAGEHSLNMSIPDMISTFFAGVPLRVPASELKHLVDISAITRDTGWTPSA
ncbi:MAG: NAD(P)-dependent oxidoreductase [Spirochaetota bacterium]